ncbi:MAG: C-methyltransferase [Solirubrobacterales bacterium]|nr:C-methyltransferase [Solirubrobacterales bacterium]
MSASCRFCDTPLEHVFADLGKSPVANDLIKPEKLAGMEPFYPLKAYVCSSCLLVQLEDFQPADELFDDDYLYLSSYSSSWLAHAKRYTEQMIERFGFDSSSQVVELASNDGYLLQYFVEAGVPVLGIEPAANVAEIARGKGVDTIAEFFGVDTAREVVASGKKADLLLGNNVLAHVPFIKDFVGGMKVLLADDGVITMEFPQLLTQVQLMQWDTIYHEHFSYLSFLAVQKIFAAHDLRLFDVETLPTHGGSLRIYGCHADDASKPDGPAVAEQLAREEAAGLRNLQTYLDFGPRVQADKRQIMAFMVEQKEAGKTIVGYGAPAKGNTLLNYCGLGTDFLDYTVDRNPEKQGRYLPGAQIPVMDPERIRETKPDIVLILPWNLREEVMEQMAYIREWGGSFAARAPELQLFP